MVKAQASLEYLMLLALAGVLSVTVVATTNAQFSAQNEFHANATSLLANSTGFNFSNPEYDPYENATAPNLELHLSVSQPAYVGQPAIAQAAIYNYGSPTTLASLALESPNSSLSITPREKSDVPVRFSYSLNSIITANKSGTYAITAVAVGQDGKRLNTSVAFAVLQSPGGQLPPGPVYKLSIARLNESASYALTPLSEDIYTVSVATAQRGSSGTCTDCPAKVGGSPVSAIWWYSVTSSSGVSNWCACLYFSKLAVPATISPAAQPSFTLKLNATNSANLTAQFALTLDKASDSNQYGLLSTTGKPFVTGDSPYIDSIATSPDKKQWTLRPMLNFNDYRSARSNFESKLVGATGWCSYDCNGAISAAGALNAQAGSLLSATTAHNCTSNATNVACAPAILTFPSLKLGLDQSFIGSSIPCESPDSVIASGITVEVSTCR